jgi:hypothetical protein
VSFLGSFSHVERQRSEDNWEIKEKIVGCGEKLHRITKRAISLGSHAAEFDFSAGRPDACRQ